MILVAAVLLITLVASGPISSSLLSSLSLVNAQTSTQTTSYDTGLVTCSGTSQVCDTHPSFSVQTNSVLEAQFTTATIHCSAISVDVSVDGGSSHSLGTLGPGQTGPLVNLGPVSAGSHILTLTATGQLGGCNTGSLFSWQGTLAVTTTPIPPYTTITSAIDGDGITLVNDSSTLSTSIQISFTGKAGSNNIAGFECRIDSGAFSPCSSPSTLTNLSAGKHTFQVRAVDTLGNRDSTPATFGWTIATITPPTKTTITSAVDGNNAPVQNGGTTTSSSIKIAFTATQGSNPIAGFQCSLDNSPFSSCTSPAVFNNLATGSHKFVVVAVDTAGNKDPTPATFSWTVGTVTPTQSIQQLAQLKHSMHLDPVTDRTLDIRLNIALQFAQNNIKSGTCIQLTVFIKQVQGSNGHVTSAQANQLIQAAQNIQTALGCTVASSGNGIAASSASMSPPSLNLTRNQQQPQTTASSPSLLQPQSQSHPYTNQYLYPSQHPFLFQNPRSQLPQNQQPPPVTQR